MEASPRGLATDEAGLERMLAVSWAKRPWIRELVRPEVVRHVRDHSGDERLDLSVGELIGLVFEERDSAPGIAAVGHLADHAVVRPSDPNLDRREPRPKVTTEARRERVERNRCRQHNEILADNVGVGGARSREHGGAIPAWQTQPSVLPQPSESAPGR